MRFRSMARSSVGHQAGPSAQRKLVRIGTGFWSKQPRLFPGKSQHSPLLEQLSPGAVQLLGTHQFEPS
jgi:hypothetical protein